MALPKERISYLLEAWTSKTATAAEEQELMEWVAEAKEDSELKTYMEGLWQQFRPGTQFNYVDWPQMFDNIMQPAKVYSIAPKPRVRWTRIAAAAVIILSLSIGGYFYFTRNTHQPIATAQKIQNTVPAPSSGKATITLANGKQITLDSAMNGTLAKEGNVNVQKLADGEIAYTGTSSEVQYNTLSNPRGSKVISLTLADGSKVWLNAESSLTYPTAFAGNERKVEITGEAYFEVTHNPNMPFKVTKDAAEITVLGTHFNVNAYSDEDALKVTLLEGSVKITDNEKTLTIKPGEQVVATSNQLTLNRNIDLDQVMAWKNGLFNFNKTNISSIMRQMERWYDVSVEYEGGEPAITLSGVISRNINAGKVLEMLQLSGVHFRIEGKKIIVSQ